MVSLRLEFASPLCLGFNRSLRIVYFLLSLLDSLLDFACLLRQIRDCTSLQINFALRSRQLGGHALEQHRGRRTLVLCLSSALHLPFLVLPIRQFKLQQLLPLVGVHLLPLLKVGDLDHELLLVHFSLDLIQHSNGNVVDDFKLFVYLWQHDLEVNGNACAQFIQLYNKLKLRILMKLLNLL